MSLRGWLRDWMAKRLYAAWHPRLAALGEVAKAEVIKPPKPAAAGCRSARRAVSRAKLRKVVG